MFSIDSSFHIFKPSPQPFDRIFLIPDTERMRVFIHQVNGRYIFQPYGVPAYPDFIPDLAGITGGKHNRI
jgi:hypothetical protein